MVSRDHAASRARTRLATYWSRLDRGWRAVALGLLVVGVQWVRQLF